MAEMLTPQQKEAVYNRGGKLLVSAAAGSGKTKVLVDRLMSYVMDSTAPANLDDFLIITYTKAAASELREKIGKKLNELIAQNPGNRHLQRQMPRLYLAKISTVHSFCADILREYAYRLDIPGDFRVADQLECNQLQLQALEYILDAAYETKSDDPCFRAFIDSQGFGRNDRQIPQLILKVYQSAVCHLDPQGWLEWCLDMTNVDELADAGQTIWGEYLIRDFKHTLKMHIQALNTCIQQTDGAAGFEKPAALLASTVQQLEALCNCDSWDAIVGFGEVDFGRLVFPKNCSDLSLVDQIKAVRGACKKAVEKKQQAFFNDSSLVVQDLIASADAVCGLVDLVKAFMTRYQGLKRSRRILDFTDLEQLSLDLLRGKRRSVPTAAAAEIASRYREIMVDEYQDSNEVQDAIFDALTHKKQNCFMVGDVKQSIYQFRLADPSIFIDKYNRYVPPETALTGQGRKVLLSSNFRSSGGVISAVNHVFTACMSRPVGGLDYGPEEMLREGIPHISLEEPEVELYGIEVEADTYGEEAAFVANRIRELLDGSHMVRQGETLRPICPSDIVILLRSPGSVGGDFELALALQGIACNTVSGENFLCAPELVTLRSILQIIDNPLQDIPLLSALMSPVFAFTADELAHLRSHQKKCSFFEALKREKTDKVNSFLETLAQLRRDARLDTVSELVSHIIKRTNLLRIYNAMPDGQKHTENIFRFCQLVSDFENGNRKDLHSFLEFLEALLENGITEASSSPNSDSVTIMSIHKSKGLEFPVVFLCGLSRRFNEESARGQVLCHKQLGLGLSCVNKGQRVRYPSVAKSAIAEQILAEGVSEELRVLYVAMTRARDRLIMTYAVKNLDADLKDISQRLRNSPRELLTRDVSCPGEWVLQAALTRTEAGAFFELGGNPGVATVSEDPWKIQVVNGVPLETAVSEKAQEQPQISTAVLQKIRDGLGYTYPYLAATKTPSKQTATQLKGRFKDQEVSEGTVEPRKQEFRKLIFGASHSGSLEYGTAMHTFMQHLRYEACGDLEGVREEGTRLLKEKILTQEQFNSLSFSQIAEFFQTLLGRALSAGGEILREFKFSLLMDGTKFNSDVKGEYVLLQGVVDCALIEDDGITLVDFKTDRVTPDSLGDKVAAYTPQVRAYADALEKIFERPVKKALLYFFTMGTFAQVER